MSTKLGFFARLATSGLGVVGQVTQLYASAVGQAIEREAPTYETPVVLAPKRMPAALHLTLGLESVPLFPDGAIDDLAFFQRGGVSPRAEVEYVTRLDPADRGTENFRSYGLFRLTEDARPIPSLDATGELRARLEKGFGLLGLPTAASLQGAPFGTGLNRVACARPEKLFGKNGPRRYTHSEVLDLIRAELSPIQKLAWIEGSFTAPPPGGGIDHRYYLGGQKQVYLVRHDTDGKRLFLLLTSDEALKVCVTSAARVRRFGEKAA